jgi:SAM-dependent methyltransferase
LDRDRSALAFIEARNGESAGRAEALFKTRYIDLHRDPWPYKADSIGAIVSVHWSFERMVGEFASALKPGGFLLLETIGGQGANYRSLPEVGFFGTALSDAFEIRYLKERRVGPAGTNAAAAKVFAVKQVVTQQL